MLLALGSFMLWKDLPLVLGLVCLSVKSSLESKPLLFLLCGLGLYWSVLLAAIGQNVDNDATTVQDSSADDNEFEDDVAVVDQDNDAEQAAFNLGFQFQDATQDQDVDQDATQEDFNFQIAFSQQADDESANIRDGDDGDGDGDGNGDGDRVTLCHIPPGNPENPQTITVSENAVPAHLAHGDTLGPYP